MINVRCESCQVHLQFEDEKAGAIMFCPDCQASLIVPKRQGIHQAGCCFLCDQLQPTSHCYLRAGQLGSSGLATVERYVFLHCFLCNECYRAVNWLHALRFLVLFAVFAVIIACFAAGFPVMFYAERVYGKSSAPHMVAVLGFLVLPWASLPAGILYLAWLIPRRLRQRVSDKAHNYLYRLGLETDWGLTSRLTAYTHLPWGQTAVE